MTSKSPKKNRTPNKKAQFYIFTAVILLTVLFSLHASMPTATKKETNQFSELKKNFQKESTITINSAIYSQSNISRQWEEFITAHYNYAKTKEPGFGMITFLSYDDESGKWVRIDNKLGKDTVIEADTTMTIQNDASATINRPSTINATFDIGGKSETYAFEITETTKARAIMVSSTNKKFQITQIQ